MNPYRDSRPDFRALADKSERLARVVVPSEHDASLLTIDFKDPEASIALTEAILEHDFGVFTTLRDDRLCPPIPNRLAYLDWVREILGQTQETAICISSLGQGQDDSGDNTIERPSKRMKKEAPPPRIRILDIGTGASCIHPLLGCAMKDDWEFIGTDIDPLSIRSAQQTIVDSRMNNEEESLGRVTQGRKLKLKDRIHLLLRSDKKKDQDTLLLEEGDIESLKLEKLPWSSVEGELLYHAAMCNPPFYASFEEMQASLDKKVEAPNAVCLGSKEEMICEGGEVAFIGRMITESKKLQNKVLWFTSLVGKYSSIEPLRKRFTDEGVSSVYFSPLKTGRTARFAVAWTFKLYRSSTIKTISARSRPILQRRMCGKVKDADTGLTAIKTFLNQFAIPWATTSHGEIIALPSRRTWDRKGKRQRDKGMFTATTHASIIIGVLLRSSADGEITAHWVYGREENHFYSLMSVLQKSLENPQSDT